MVFSFTFFSYHLLLLSLSLSQKGWFCTYCFCKESYHWEWPLEKSFARQLFCLPSSNDLDRSDAMACSKEDRPVELLLMTWIIWLGRPLPKRLFGLVICFIKEHFIPDRIWSVFGGYWFIFHNWPYDPPSTEMIKPTRYNALPWILLVCALKSFQALLITPHSNEKKSTQSLKENFHTILSFHLLSFFCSCLTVFWPS